MGCHFLLQGTFPTQELNPGLQHCRQILYQLRYERSPYSNRWAKYSRAVTMIVNKIKHLKIYQGLPWWSNGKESALQYRGCRFNPWVGKVPWRRKWQPTPVFLPGESHGLRSLVGYSPQGRRVGHTHTRTHTLFESIYKTRPLALTNHGGRVPACCRQSSQICQMLIS